MKLVSAEQMRALDRVAIDSLGIPGWELMDRAGRAVAREVVALAAAHGGAGDRPRTFVALAGAGNNGGDAYVAARVLTAWGWRGRIFEWVDPERVRGDAARHRARTIAAGVPCGPCADLAEIAAAGIVIDGLLGTGLTGELRPRFREAIDAVNESGRPIVAIDLPSGLHADTGRALPIAVRATTTVTMALPKIGLAVGDGPRWSGAVRVADIGIPRDPGRIARDPARIASGSSRSASGPERTALDGAAGEVLDWFDEETAAAMVSPLSRIAHKGTHGRVLVVAGSVGFAGAAALCIDGALRAGAGLVSAVVPADIAPVVSAAVREAMVHPAPCAEGRLDSAAADLLRRLAAGVDVVAVGPGLGGSDAVRDVVVEVLRDLPVAVVIDADGLNVLGAPPAALPRPTGAATVLTPHPGELARLVADTDPDLDPTDRDACRRAARSLAIRTGAVVVAKGAASVVIDPADESVSVNASGNPGMATGGVGDVLTGLIAGRVACGDAAAAASRIGVYVHGAAGDLAARTEGERGLLPRHLLEAVGPVWRRLESRPVG